MALIKKYLFNYKNFVYDIADYYNENYIGKEDKYDSSNFGDWFYNLCKKYQIKEFNVLELEEIFDNEFGNDDNLIIGYEQGFYYYNLLEDDLLHLVNSGLVFLHNYYDSVNKYYSVADGNEEIKNNKELIDNYCDTYLEIANILYDNPFLTIDEIKSKVNNNGMLWNIFPCDLYNSKIKFDNQINYKLDYSNLTKYYYTIKYLFDKYNGKPSNITIEEINKVRNGN